MQTKTTGGRVVASLTRLALVVVLFAVAGMALGLAAGNLGLWLAASAALGAGVGSVLLQN